MEYKREPQIEIGGPYTETGSMLIVFKNVSSNTNITAGIDGATYVHVNKDHREAVATQLESVVAKLREVGK